MELPLRSGDSCRNYAHMASVFIYIYETHVSTLTHTHNFTVLTAVNLGEKLGPVAN